MQDVTIIGGGPAGASLGCLLAKAGISSTIIESSNHPRQHVGESMVTSSTRVFEEIGFLPVLEKERFVRKYGASWHSIAGHEAAIWFREFPQEGVHQDYTYHVDRSRFDLLLLKHAEALGARVYQGARVSEVLFDRNRAVGVKVNVAGSEVEVPSRIVVDASGRSAVLGRQLKLKQNDPIFDQFAVHAWFTGVERGRRETQDFIHIYFLPVERGWCWQIPITNEITSIGIVAEKRVFKDAVANVDEYFMRFVGSNRALMRAMSGATRIDQYKKESDYSYSMKKFVGDGYLIVGDAARFVDPIFSSGVSIALYSAKYAAERICLALKAGDFSATMFDPYEMKVRAGVDIWYEFIRLYYKLLPMFTYFLQSKEHRLEVLRLLQGEVYDRSEVKVLTAMREFIRDVEAHSDHSLRRYLSEVPIN